MNVLLVSSLEAGGPLEHSLTLAKAMRPHAEVSAVCASAELAERFAAAGARPHVLPLRSAADTGGGWRLWKLMRDFDVIHAQDRRSGLWSRVWPRRSGQAVVYTVHGLPDPYLPAGVPGRAVPTARDRIAYQGLDPILAHRGAVVTASRFLRDALVRRLGYPTDRIEVIPNGVEPADLPTAGDLVGTVSMLDPVKGLDGFLRAAARVHATHPDQRFAIYGEGPARAELESLAARLGLAAVVSFPGHVPAAEALSCLRLFVLCSWMENCPMALLEAMAAARPAVATAVGGVPEIAGDCVPLVEVDDDRALAEAITGLLDDPARAERLGGCGRDRVLADFTAERNATRLLELYARLIGVAA